MLVLRDKVLMAIDIVAITIAKMAITKVISTLFIMVSYSIAKFTIIDSNLKVSLFIVVAITVIIELDSSSFTITV